MNRLQDNLFGVFKVNQQRHIILLRVTLAIFVATHGWARFVNDAVAPFGEFLSGVGFPFGLAIASGITVFEIVGSLLFAAGWQIRYLAVIFSGIYLMGIVLVHFQEGWFVVGLGRNGMEYSVLLIICFLIVGHSTVTEEREQ